MATRNENRICGLIPNVDNKGCLLRGNIRNEVTGNFYQDKPVVKEPYLFPSRHCTTQVELAHGCTLSISLRFGPNAQVLGASAGKWLTKSLGAQRRP